MNNVYVIEDNEKNMKLFRAILKLIPGIGIWAPIRKITRINNVNKTLFLNSGILNMLAIALAISYLSSFLAFSGSSANFLPHVKHNDVINSSIGIGLIIACAVSLSHFSHHVFAVITSNKSPII